MPCRPFRTENGATGFVCGGPRTRRCSCGSGRPADRRCDWKVKSRRSGTCDKALCSACTHEPAKDKDLCPDHARQWQEMKR